MGNTTPPRRGKTKKKAGHVKFIRESTKIGGHVKLIRESTKVLPRDGESYFPYIKQSYAQVFGLARKDLCLVSSYIAMWSIARFLF